MKSDKIRDLLFIESALKSAEEVNNRALSKIPLHWIVEMLKTIKQEKEAAAKRPSVPLQPETVVKGVGVYIQIKAHTCIALLSIMAKHGHLEEKNC